MGSAVRPGEDKDCSTHQRGHTREKDDGGDPRRQRRQYPATGQTRDADQAESGSSPPRRDAPLDEVRQLEQHNRGRRQQRSRHRHRKHDEFPGSHGPPDPEALFVLLGGREFQAGIQFAAIRQQPEVARIAAQHEHVERKRYHDEDQRENTR
jgi:hypothetical protein